ncbi:MAG: hypothetical protein BWZ01_03193 [Deltaproteobacteria bacterium ADurb.BinA179]|nr:MAG: hypothetical protein BWZ01_03193 [Deltaproteobacteria bacterium ADurb.BinA179]
MLLVCTFLEHHRVIPEPYILFREVSLQVLVDPDTHPFRLGDNPKNGRFPVGDMDRVGEHVEDSKIVLDDDNRPGGSKRPDDPGGGHPLVDVQERGDLIEEVEVSLAGKAGHDCHPLELTSREGCDVMIEQGREHQGPDVLIEVSPLVSCFEELCRGSRKHPRDIIDVLGLDRHFQAFL